MATNKPNLRSVSLKVNYAQVSLDSSQGFVDIWSRCRYENDTLKRIVGAVTIIFTDGSQDAASDTGTATSVCNGNQWTDIPTSLSILPCPGYDQRIFTENSDYSLQKRSLPKPRESQMDTNQTQITVRSKEKEGDDVTDGVDMFINRNKHVTCSSSKHSEPLVDSGEAVRIKTEPMSPEKDMFGSVKCYTESAKSASDTSKSLSNNAGLQESMQPHLTVHKDDFAAGQRQPNLGKFPFSKCSVCFKELRSRKDFMFHVGAHNNVGDSGQQCPVCLIILKRRVDMTKHSLMHFAHEMYCCPVCQISISQLDSFKRHFHKRHPASLPKLKSYLTYFRHNVSARHEAETDEQITTDGGLRSSAGLVQTTIDRRRKASTRVMRSAKLTALRNVTGKGRKPILPKKRQLDGDTEGVQGMNSSVEEQEQSCKNSTTDLNSGSKGQKTSKCSFCWSEMTDLDDFVNHMEAHKAIMKVPNTCPVCLHEFNDKMRVKRHASKHVQTTMYICPICNFETPRVDSFRRHVRKVHPEHAGDINVFTNCNMSQPGLSRRVPEANSEDLEIPVSSSHSLCVLSTADHMNVKQELTSDNYFDGTPSEDTKIKQEVSYSDTEDNHVADLYSGLDTNQTPAQNSPSSDQMYGDQVALTSDSWCSHSETPPSCQELDVQRDIEWQLESSPHHTTTGDEFHPGSVTKPSTSVSDKHKPQRGPILCCTQDLATFKAPKRGGYRLKRNISNNTPTLEQPALQISPQSPYGTPGKKKTKKSHHLSCVCFFCSATLRNTQEFLEHARLHATGDKITCPVCVTDYARKLGLVRHSVNHVPSNDHICDICETSFARRDVMLRHYRKVHKRTPNYVRQEVDPFQISSADELPVLSFESITAPSIPPMPGDGDSQSPIGEAMCMVEESDMMYSCGLCGAEYQDAQTLQDHIRNDPHEIL